MKSQLVFLVLAGSILIELIHASEKQLSDQKCPNGQYGCLASYENKKICSLDVKAGPCRGSFLRFFFNKETQQCEEFIYGGCQGNENNFETIKECQKQCSHNAKNPIHKKCKKRNHDKKQNQENPDICSLNAVPGMCEAYIPRYFFNKKTQKCEKFIYGGCGGNENNFDTLEKCYSVCKKPENPPEPSNKCLLPKETGPCKAAFKKFYFNTQTNKCESFIYGGCQGNENRFDSLEECNAECSKKIDICSLDAETGRCRARIPRYFFNKNTHKCEEFIYGGCGGNENNFDTVESCKKMCI